MSNPTPGPWGVELGVIRGPREESIAVMVDDGCPLPMSIQDHETTSANARLISAAPDLLSALLNLQFHCIQNGWADSLLLEARAAILKAKGPTK